MTTQYTPGPWDYQKRIDEGYRIFKDNTANAIANIDEWQNLQTTKANAKLISAAPGLFEACNDVLDLLTSTSYEKIDNKTIVRLTFFKDAMDCIATLKKAVKL